MNSSEWTMLSVEWRGRGEFMQAVCFFLPEVHTVLGVVFGIALNKVVGLVAPLDLKMQDCLCSDGQRFVATWRHWVMRV